MASISEARGPEHAKSMPGYSFGVRSYLHYFYEECTASVWDQEDVQNQRSHYWWSSGLCKISLAFGAFLLAMGLVVLAVGFAVPTRIEAFGEGELLFVDRHSMRYNQVLSMCVQAGTGMLTLGGLMLTAGLLLSAFSRPTTNPEPPGKEKKGIIGRGGGAAGRTPTNVLTKAPSPAAGEVAVPVLSKVENIQP
ncbi:neurensin 1-like isoform 1-T2 [Clarias gariepinus]|uniref:neurensin 1-like n=1 Tax=Clarias gariepinus TaxID=13013 RepID=UPI00234C8C43|nr:neurensin 1-like [Clarias gariepinus]XP_053346369.1 neurensin 1-like [Clarias gariepinus]